MTTACTKKVLLFGEASELVGCKEITIQFPTLCTDKTLKDIITEQLDKLKPIKDSLAIAVNWNYTDINTSLNQISIEDIEEIAILPPISGVLTKFIVYTKNSRYFIKISTEPIQYSTVFDLISDSSVGAVSTFFGIIRKYDREGVVVQALDYECYLKMAYLEMERIIQNSYKLWLSLVHVVVFHRYGLIPAGEIGIAIAVSSPHRKDSLDAVKFIIDSVKSHLPIWKKEIYEDGTSKWKRNNECFWLCENK
ncbi:unnamed protein product [Schistosoma turkestanicum]|nr:unnamed protein product [Schistosoma turkestanicum]